MEVGFVLGGKYRLEALLGRGGMGSVWRAMHLGLHAPVAIKLIEPHIIQNPEAIERFHREARAAAGLRSPHVVQILDHGLDEATRAPFIAMELLEGESLAERLERVQRLSPAETARVLSHVSRALSRAHENGVVHRDLKPENVFIVRNDDEEIAKVLDFGIAKSQGTLGSDSATRTGAVMGTPYYMSPEQISGAKNVDFRADLWALGVIACECLTGRRPFEAESVGGLALRICVEPLPQPSSLAAVPPGFDSWFERAVARDPSLRFSTARELAEQLRQVCGSQAMAVQAGYAPASVPAGTPAPLPSMSALSRTSNDLSGGVPRGRGRWFVLAGALGLSAIAVAAWFWLGSAQRPDVQVSVASSAPLPDRQLPTTASALLPVSALPAASAVPTTSAAPTTSSAPVPAASSVSSAVPATPLPLPKATAKHTNPSAKVPPTAPTEQKQAPAATATAAPKLDARSVINSRR